MLAVLPGTDPILKEEVILIGAHIDHLGLADNDQIYSGADDNASGAAVVLDLARMFSRCDLSPKRTLVFVQWNAEEKGILGSRYYVDHPIYPLSSTIAVYNFDMVGAGDGTGVLLFGGHDDENLFLTSLMEEAASEAGLSYTIQIVPQKMASDHAPFVERLFLPQRGTVLGHQAPAAPQERPRPRTRRHAAWHPMPGGLRAS